MPEDVENQASFGLKSGERTVLTHVVPILHIRIPIDPSAAESKDDKFTLKSSDGSYRKVLTIKDDKVDGDQFVDLVYENLKVSLKYTLEVDPGAEGEPYLLFENIPYEELVDYYSMLEEDDELEEEEEEEEEAEEEEAEDPDWEDEGDGGGDYGGDFEDDDAEMESIMDGEEEPIEEDIIDWESFDPEREQVDADETEKTSDPTDDWGEDDPTDLGDIIREDQSDKKANVDTKTKKKIHVKKNTGVDVSENAVGVLKKILGKADLTRATITSGKRTSNDQARVMYNNLEKKGIAHQKKLYGKSGDLVIEVYEKLKGKKSSAEITKAMEKKIIEIGPSKVSKHCSDTHDVFDVDRSSIGDAKSFEKALNDSLSTGDISGFLVPPDDPAYHIVIKNK